jgi:hypothetical protein
MVDGRAVIRPGAAYGSRPEGLGSSGPPRQRKRVSEQLDIDLDQLIYTQLVLAVHEREVRHFDAEPQRNEVVLASAGLSIGQIAKLTGRSYETTKTILRRARERAAK